MQVCKWFWLPSVGMCKESNAEAGHEVRSLDDGGDKGCREATCLDCLLPRNQTPGVEGWRQQQARGRKDRETFRLLTRPLLRHRTQKQSWGNC